MDGFRLNLTRPIGFSLAAFGCTAAFAVYGAIWFLANRNGFEYNCMVDGPSLSPEDALLAPSEGSVHGYFSLWPLGVVCDWGRADGLGVVTATPSWTGTVLVLFCAAIAVVGAVYFVAGEVRARRLKVTSEAQEVNCSACRTFAHMACKQYR